MVVLKAEGTCIVLASRKEIRCVFVLSVYCVLGAAQFLLYKRDLAQQSPEMGTHTCLLRRGPGAAGRAALGDSGGHRTAFLQNPSPRPGSVNLWKAF